MIELLKELQYIYDLAMIEYEKTNNIHILLLLGNIKDAIFNLQTGIERDAARNN